MPISAGDKLGPYEILALIGAGGMGEVYRARDPRLNRDVAIKVSKERFSDRFEREARAVAALNHPNICQLYDVGPDYLVMEYVAGSRLAPPGSARKLVDIAVQIADGLAAAHAAGVVHRDLKPDNIIVGNDGRVRVLDFGLAKLARPAEPAGGDETQLMTMTAPSTILGTIAYMSPEQARADRDIDFRSDQFSFGMILYELVAGKRPFQRGTRPETLAAIIRETPQPLPGNIPVRLRWIVERLLAKEAGERYADTRDLYLDLCHLRDHWSDVPEPASAGRSHWLSAVLAACVVFPAGYVAHSVFSRVPPQALFRRLTFRRGEIRSARFAPEGHDVIYGADWEGQRPELFSVRPDNSESRPLTIPDAEVLGISASGEMALMMKPHDRGLPEPILGTLAQAPLAGGAPRELLEDVPLADWSRDGHELAAVHVVGSRARVELPLGKVIYETADRINAIRFSPKSDLLAIAEHGHGFGNSGSVSVLDRNGSKRVLVSGLAGDYADLAWAPAGGEIWFDSGVAGDPTLQAVTLTGKQRVVAQLPGRFRILDIAPDGRALVSRITWRVAAVGLPPGGKEETDFSWFDASEVDDVSADGRSILSTEFGEGGGGPWSVYLRKSDHSAGVRLGEGQALAISPDGNWALSILRTSPPQLVVLPVGAGTSRRLERGGIVDLIAGMWLPDGKRVVFTGAEAGHGPRCYVQSVDGGGPKAITPEGIIAPLAEPEISPDGKWLLTVGPEQRAWIYPLDGGTARPAPGLNQYDMPVGWADGGRSIYMFTTLALPMRIYRVAVSTGRKEFWKQFMPADAAGVREIYTFHAAPDGNWYYYSYWRTLSDLYIVEGWK